MDSLSKNPDDSTKRFKSNILRKPIMRILIDILHPAHVHVFKNFIWEMQKRGHTIKITSRSKDIANKLLDAYKLEYTNISHPSKSFLGMAWEFFYRAYKLYKIGRKFKPDVLIGCTGTTISPVGKLLGKPVFIFYDTEIVPISNMLSYPLATYVCTPDCYSKKIGKQHVKYNGYHELAYLHPNRFKPDESILKKIGLSKDEKFFIVRFVSWNTIDHIGKLGFNNKKDLVETLERYGKVLITSEIALPKEIEKYQIKIPPEEIHHVMAFATMVIGESATMASEAAALGVPAIYVSTNWRGYTNQLESKYGMVYNFNNQEKATAKIIELLNDKDLKDKWMKKREIMLKDKTDVTEWIVNFVESKINIHNL